MRQLKLLFFAVLALTFVGGIGAGAWIGSLTAQGLRRESSSVDRRADEFAAYFDLDPSQIRQLKAVLYDHDRAKEQILQRTPEQFRSMRVLEDRSRARIRELLREGQRKKYDQQRAGR